MSTPKKRGPKKAEQSSHSLKWRKDLLAKFHRECADYRGPACSENGILGGLVAKKGKL